MHRRSGVRAVLAAAGGAVVLAGSVAYLAGAPPEGRGGPPFAGAARPAVSYFDLQLLPDDASGRTYTLPLIALSAGGEAAGTAADVTLGAVNVSGYAGVPDAGAAHVTLFLFSDDGVPLRSATLQPVCPPAGCAWVLAPGAKFQVSLQDLLENAGGAPSPVVSAYGIVTIAGAGADAVSVQGAVVNAN